VAGTTIVAPVRIRMNLIHGGIWGLITGGATVATSQTVTASGEDIWAVLIALITALGAVAAAWVASRSRRGRDHLGEDEIIVSREEYERLRTIERHHRRGR